MELNGDQTRNTGIEGVRFIVLNIAPLDYERYAALYGPPLAIHMENAQVPGAEQTVQESNPISPEMKRRGSALESKTRFVKHTQDKSLRVNSGREVSPPLNGAFPTDIRTFVVLSNNGQNSSSIQRGLTSEFIAGLYQVPNKVVVGILRISA